MISAPADGPKDARLSSIPNPAFIWFPGNRDAAARTKETFQQAHKPLVDVDDALIPELTLPAVVRALQLAQVTAVSTRSSLQPLVLDAIRKIVGDGWVDQEDDLQRWLKEQR